MLGFSDAKLAVIKRGPEEVREQGLLAEYIGPDVCPHIYRYHPDGYEMEVLEPPAARNTLWLTSVFAKLTTHVWTHGSYRGWNFEWLGPLTTWAEKAPWLKNAINEVYPFEPQTGYRLIHGDPTLANLMQRSNGDLVVTDPMPRLEYRKEIPNRVEVDLGKLLQSAMGWERMLGCHNSLWQQPELVLNIAGDLKRETLLWGAIHLARVSLRAPGRGHHKIATWAKHESMALADWVFAC